YQFVVTSLAEYLPAQPTDGLVTVAGELRSGARANHLMGVGSNRVAVHRACAAAERALERTGEPLCALLLPPDRYPHALADVAWRKLVCNSAHDSSCACSTDEVVDQVVVRYAEARQIGQGLTHDAVEHLASQIDAPAGATVVVNPTGHARTGIVEITVPGEGPVVVVDGQRSTRPTQLVGEISGDAYTAMVTGQKVLWVLDLVRGSEFAGRTITSFTITQPSTADGLYDIALREAGPGEPPCDLGEVRERLLALGEQGHTARLRLVAAPLRRVLFDTGEIPGFGWATFRAIDGDPPLSQVHALESHGNLVNEHLRVQIDVTTGTYSMRTVDGLHVEGLGRLVDGGDGGDTYSYSPP